MGDRHRADDYSPAVHWAANATYDVLRAAAWLASRRWRLDVLWRAPLPEGPVMVAVNHPTSMDPLVIMHLVRRRMVFLTTFKLFYVPILSTLLKAFGMISAGEGNPRHALQDAIATLQAGRTLCVFPEGAISAGTGQMSRPRSGPARIALAAGAVVVPVGIYAPSENIKPLSVSLNGRTEQFRWYARGPYAVTFGAPLRFSQGAGGGAIRELSHAMVGAITELVEAGRRRVQGPA